MGNACEACEHPTTGKEALRLDDERDDKLAATPVDDNLSKP